MSLFTKLQEWVLTAGEEEEEGSAQVVDFSMHGTWVRKAIDEASEEERRLIMQLLLKCADLANVVRPLEIADSWGVRIMEEFYQQGEKELALGLPLTTFPNRKNFDYIFARHQSGFLVNVVRPLFDVFTQLTDAATREEILLSAAENADAWSRRQLEYEPRAERPETVTDSPLSKSDLEDVIGSSGGRRADRLKNKLWRQNTIAWMKKMKRIKFAMPTYNAMEMKGLEVPLKDDYGSDDILCALVRSTIPFIPRIELARLASLGLFGGTPAAVHDMERSDHGRELSLSKLDQAREFDSAVLVVKFNGFLDLVGRVLETDSGVGDASAVIADAVSDYLSKAVDCVLASGGDIIRMGYDGLVCIFPLSGTDDGMDAVRSEKDPTSLRIDSMRGGSVHGGAKRRISEASGAVLRAAMCAFNLVSQLSSYTPELASLSGNGETTASRAHLWPGLRRHSLGLHVMVVDSLQLSRVTIGRLLDHFGCMTHFAENASQAAAACANMEFDVILVDLMLPDLDGYEVARHVRKYGGPINSKAYVCALTEEEQPEVSEQCLRVGMNEVMQKPANMDSLRVMFRNVRELKRSLKGKMGHSICSGKQESSDLRLRRMPTRSGTNSDAMESMTGDDVKPVPVSLPRYVDMLVSASSCRALNGRRTQEDNLVGKSTAVAGQNSFRSRLASASKAMLRWSGLCGSAPSASSDSFFDIDSMSKVPSLQSQSSDEAVPNVISLLKYKEGSSTASYSSNTVDASTEVFSEEEQDEEEGRKADGEMPVCVTVTASVGFGKVSLMRVNTCVPPVDGPGDGFSFENISRDEIVVMDAPQLKESAAAAAASAAHGSANGGPFTQATMLMQLSTPGGVVLSPAAWGLVSSQCTGDTPPRLRGGARLNRLNVHEVVPPLTRHPLTLASLTANVPESPEPNASLQVLMGLVPCPLRTALYNMAEQTMTVIRDQCMDEKGSELGDGKENPSLVTLPTVPPEVIDAVMVVLYIPRGSSTDLASVKVEDTHSRSLLLTTAMSSVESLVKKFPGATLMRVTSDILFHTRSNRMGGGGEGTVMYVAFGLEVEEDTWETLTVPRHNAPAMAVAFALAARAAMIHLGNMSASVGVAMGKVVTMPMGMLQRCEWGMVGEAVHRAERLAEVGQADVLCDMKVVRRVGVLIDFDSVPHASDDDTMRARNLRRGVLDHILCQKTYSRDDTVKAGIFAHSLALGRIELGQRPKDQGSGLSSGGCVLMPEYIVPVKVNGLHKGRARSKHHHLRCASSSGEWDLLRRTKSFQVPKKIDFNGSLMVFDGNRSGVSFTGTSGRLGGDAMGFPVKSGSFSGRLLAGRSGSFSGTGEESSPGTPSSIGSSLCKGGSNASRNSVFRSTSLPCMDNIVAAIKHEVDEEAAAEALFHAAAVCSTAEVLDEAGKVSNRPINLPLISNETALISARRVVTEAQESMSPRLLFVEGPPHSGKSRVASAVLDLPEMKRLWLIRTRGDGKFVQRGMNAKSLSPFIGIFHQLLGFTDDIPPRERTTAIVELLERCGSGKERFGRYAKPILELLALNEYQIGKPSPKGEDEDTASKSSKSSMWNNHSICSGSSRFSAGGRQSGSHLSHTPWEHLGSQTEQVVSTTSSLAILDSFADDSASLLRDGARYLSKPVMAALMNDGFGTDFIHLSKRGSEANDDGMTYGRDPLECSQLAGKLASAVAITRQRNGVQRRDHKRRFFASLHRHQNTLANMLLSNDGVTRLCTALALMLQQLLLGRSVQASPAQPSLPGWLLLIEDSDRLDPLSMRLVREIFEHCSIPIVVMMCQQVQTQPPGSDGTEAVIVEQPPAALRAGSKPVPRRSLSSPLNAPQNSSTSSSSLGTGSDLSSRHFDGREAVDDVLGVHLGFATKQGAREDLTWMLNQSFTTRVTLTPLSQSETRALVEHCAVSYLFNRDEMGTNDDSTEKEVGSVMKGPRRSSTTLNGDSGETLVVGLPSSLHSAVYKQTAGDPLHASMVTNLLVSSGAIHVATSNQSEMEEVRIKDGGEMMYHITNMSLKEVILETVRELPKDAACAIRALSVLGASFSTAHACEMVSMQLATSKTYLKDVNYAPRTVQALRKLMKCGFINAEWGSVVDVHRAASVAANELKRKFPGAVENLSFNARWLWKHSRRARGAAGTKGSMSRIPGMCFTNFTVQQILYRELSPEERRRFHLDAVAVLQRNSKHVKKAQGGPLAISLLLEQTAYHMSNAALHNSKSDQDEASMSFSATDNFPSTPHAGRTNVTECANASWFKDSANLYEDASRQHLSRGDIPSALSSISFAASSAAPCLQAKKPQRMSIAYQHNEEKKTLVLRIAAWRLLVFRITLDIGDRLPPLTYVDLESEPALQRIHRTLAALNRKLPILRPCEWFNAKHVQKQTAQLREMVTMVLTRLFLDGQEGTFVTLEATSIGCFGVVSDRLSKMRNLGIRLEQALRRSLAPRLCKPDDVVPHNLTYLFSSLTFKDPDARIEEAHVDVRHDDETSSSFRAMSEMKETGVGNVLEYVKQMRNVMRPSLVQWAENELALEAMSDLSITTAFSGRLLSTLNTTIAHAKAFCIAPAPCALDAALLLSCIAVICHPDQRTKVLVHVKDIIELETARQQQEKDAGVNSGRRSSIGAMFDLEFLTNAKLPVKFATPRPPSRSGKTFLMRSLAFCNQGYWIEARESASKAVALIGDGSNRLSDLGRCLGATADAYLGRWETCLSAMNALLHDRRHHAEIAPWCLALRMASNTAMNRPDVAVESWRDALLHAPFSDLQLHPEHFHVLGVEEDMLSKTAKSMPVMVVCRAFATQALWSSGAHSEAVMMAEQVSRQLQHLHSPMHCLLPAAALALGEVAARACHVGMLKKKVGRKVLGECYAFLAIKAPTLLPFSAPLAVKLAEVSPRGFL